MIVSTPVRYYLVYHIGIYTQWHVGFHTLIYKVWHIDLKKYYPFNVKGNGGGLNYGNSNGGMVG